MHIKNQWHIYRQDFDIVMSMYNLLVYSNNYPMTSRILWNYYRDEVNDDVNKYNDDDYRINNENTATNKPFEYNRAYFRIQGKRSTCSKRTSYLGSTSLLDSTKLMKALVTLGLNRLSSLHILSWHITLFTVSYFLSEILRILDNGRNRSLETFYSFFSRSLQRYHHWIVNPWRAFLENSVKIFPIWYASEENFVF